MTSASTKTREPLQSKTKVVGVRLDPRLRYLTELAARKQRRSISSFIEWAIEESLGNVLLREESEYEGDPPTVADEASALWDVDDADRFAKLALKYPDLLTHEEQVLWKLVRGNECLWRGSYKSDAWRWKVDESSLIFGRLREYWPLFNSVAKGSEELSKLPMRTKEQPTTGDDVPIDDPDGDIPF